MVEGSNVCWKSHHSDFLPDVESIRQVPGHGERTDACGCSDHQRHICSAVVTCSLDLRDVHLRFGEDEHGSSGISMHHACRLPGWYNVAIFQSNARLRLKD
jgi:hypothetical protein